MSSILVKMDEHAGNASAFCGNQGCSNPVRYKLKTI